MDRLYALVEELRAVSPRPRSARWLAEHFEVSTRTIERDILALQQAAVPIHAVTGRLGGYTVDRAHTLPPLNISPQEAIAVAVGLHALAGTPFRDPARAVLHKLLAAMPERDVQTTRLLASRVRRIVPAEAGEVPEAVTQALVAARVLRLSYVDGKGAESERLVEPLGFLAGTRNWYLIAWCRMREAVRGFRLDRIRAATTTPEAAPYREIDLSELDALDQEVAGLDLPGAP